MVISSRYFWKTQKYNRAPYDISTRAAQLHWEEEQREIQDVGVVLGQLSLDFRRPQSSEMDKLGLFAKTCPQ